MKSLKAVHADRREYGGSWTGQEAFRAINSTLAALERRRPGCTHALNHWRVQRCANGELVGVPIFDADPPRPRAHLTMQQMLQRQRLHAAQIHGFIR
jgi:hypothetical protein